MQMLHYKMSQRINLLKSLATVKFGADPLVLKLFYVSTIRSLFDYCCLAISPPRRHFDPIQKLQYAALRIILGCMRSTPIHCLLSESGEMPLVIRRILIGTRNLVKHFQVNNHLLFAELEKLENILRTTRRRNFKPVLPLLRAYQIINEHFPNLSKSNRLPIYDYSYYLNINVSPTLTLFPHADLPTTRIPQIFNLFMEPLAPPEFRIFTDASKFGHHTGAAIFSTYPFHLQYTLRNYCSIFTAELFAIQQAIKLVICHQICNAIILSDSKSALQSISTKSTSHDSAFLIETRMLAINGMQNFNLQFIWIPGHKNIEGNEVADRLAKEAHQVISYVVTPKDVHTKIKNETFNIWPQAWIEISQTRGQWYYEIVKAPLKKPWFLNIKYKCRKDITTVTRLRTNHCQSPAHLHKIGVFTSPQCSCGYAQGNINHLLLGCNNNKVHINNFIRSIRSLSQLDTGPFRMEDVLRHPNSHMISLINYHITNCKLVL